ncbi:MAG TPA: hypothetical protein VFB60_21690 [Ktedonobacteraceae bacterium]|nr:hypothetical protein [Ktedonobacteraceae bacterium]
MEISVRALRAMRFTLFVYSVMVWGWGYFLLNNIKGVPFILTLLLPLVVALPLLLLTIRFSRKLHGLTGPRLFTNKRAVWLYVIGVAVTVIGYILANIIARVLQHPEYVIPGATLALGMHFLFIGLAFDERRAYITLAVFCLIAIIVPLIVPGQFTLGPIATSLAGSGWMIVISIIGMVWLGSMAIYLLTFGGRNLQLTKERQQAVQPGY